MKKLGKLLIVSVLALAVAIAAAGCGSKQESSQPKTLLDQIKAKGEITMATSPDYPPFEFIDDKGNVAGLDIDLANAIAKEMGVKLTIQQMGFDGIITAVKAGQVNMGVSGFTVTEERKKSIDFTDPYFTGGQVIVALKESNFKGPEDLNGKVVGAQIGTTGEKAANGIKGAQVKTFDDFLMAIQELKNKNIAAVVGDMSVAKNLVASDSKLVIVGKPINEEQTAIIVQKGHPELVKALNDAIAKVKASGEYDKIIQKWANQKAQ